MSKAQHNSSRRLRYAGILSLIVRRPATNERAVIESGELSIEDGLVGDNWKSRGRIRPNDPVTVLRRGPGGGEGRDLR
jgi:hypothetical protein